MKILNNPWKSLWFVLIQFLCLALIGLTGPIFPRSTVLLLIELAGLFLGVWAVLVMRIGNFNITPDPLKWSKLVMDGPYELIRHPMYLALLLTTLPLVINSFSFFRRIIWVFLLVNQILKLNYEEKLLAASLEGYQQYIKGSRKLIPLLY